MEISPNDTRLEDEKPPLWRRIGSAACDALPVVGAGAALGAALSLFAIPWMSEGPDCPAGTRTNTQLWDYPIDAQLDFGLDAPKVQGISTYNSEREALDRFPFVNPVEKGRKEDYTLETFKERFAKMKSYAPFKGTWKRLSDSLTPEEMGVGALKSMVNLILRSGCEKAEDDVIFRKEWMKKLALNSEQWRTVALQLMKIADDGGVLGEKQMGEFLKILREDVWVINNTKDGKKRELEALTRNLEVTAIAQRLAWEEMNGQNFDEIEGIKFADLCPLDRLRAARNILKKRKWLPKGGRDTLVASDPEASAWITDFDAKFRKYMSSLRRAAIELEPVVDIVEYRKQELLNTLAGHRFFLKDLWCGQEIEPAKCRDIKNGVSVFLQDNEWLDIADRLRQWLKDESHALSCDREGLAASVVFDASMEHPRFRDDESSDSGKWVRKVAEELMRATTAIEAGIIATRCPSQAKMNQGSSPGMTCVSEVAAYEACLESEPTKTSWMSFPSATDSLTEEWVATINVAAQKTSVADMVVLPGHPLASVCDAPAEDPELTMPEGTEWPPRRSWSKSKFSNTANVLRSLFPDLCRQAKGERKCHPVSREKWRENIIKIGNNWNIPSEYSDNYVQDILNNFNHVFRDTRDLQEDFKLDLLVDRFQTLLLAMDAALLKVGCLEMVQGQGNISLPPNSVTTTAAGDTTWYECTGENGTEPASPPRFNPYTRLKQLGDFYNRHKCNKRALEMQSIDEWRENELRERTEEFLHLFHSSKYSSPHIENVNVPDRFGRCLEASSHGRPLNMSRTRDRLFLNTVKLMEGLTPKLANKKVSPLKGNQKVWSSSQKHWNEVANNVKEYLEANPLSSRENYLRSIFLGDADTPPCINRAAVNVAAFQLSIAEAWWQISCRELLQQWALDPPEGLTVEGKREYVKARLKEFYSSLRCVDRAPPDYNATEPAKIDYQQWRMLANTD